MYNIHLLHRRYTLLTTHSQPRAAYRAANVPHDGIQKKTRIDAAFVIEGRCNHNVDTSSTSF